MLGVTILAAYVDAPDHVCCRYRLAAFAPYWQKLGLSLRLHTWPKGLARLRIGCAVADADAVVIQRKLLPAWQTALLRYRTRRLLFDFDDAVWLRDSFSRRGFVSSRRMRRFARTMRTVDAITAGNRYLAEHAADHAGDKPIVVVPTCVEPNDYPMAAHEDSATFDLVWIGSSSTLHGLEAAAPILEAIGEAIPKARLKIICDRFLKLQRLPTLAVPWTPAAEKSEIASAAVGISWIPNDPWSRGKCGLKVLQYMAAGLPVVANSVGVQNDLVRSDETGYRADTMDEWLSALRLLAADAALRRRLGSAGRRLVEQDYSVSAGAAKWSALAAQLGILPV